MDIKELKKIVTLVEEANISSLKLETDGTKIEISKELTNNTPVQTIVQSLPAAPLVTPGVMEQTAVTAPQTATSNQSEAESTTNLVPIKSPMVGTFYTSPNPESPAFVKVGDTLSPGKVVCIIEAMKLFNEIESEINGTIEKVLVENATPVEYGQELFLVRP